MALMYTPPGELGSIMPRFSLPTVTGDQFDSETIAAKAIIVMFICNHCPYVKAIEDRYVALAHHFSDAPVQFIGICSNDYNDYPEDAPSELYKRWKEKNYSFPYLIDESQEVAKSFDAICTPDIYLYDSEKKLAYRGRFDDSWKDATKVENEDLKSAILHVLEGTPIPEQAPSMGCSIKWKT